MKRQREEDSEDEIFERRRKVHKQEKDAKDEIEDLFEEPSSENTVEEKPQEVERWGIKGAAAAGILLEIFGDGTDYLDVLEHYAKQYSYDNDEDKAEEPEEAPKTFSQIDKEEIISKVTEALLEIVPSFSKKDIETMVGNIVEDKSLVDVLTESFHCIDTEKNHMAVLHARKLVDLYKKKDSILAKLPKIVDKKVKTVISCAHTLKTEEEYTRLVQYVYSLQSAACTDEDRTMGADITQKIANVSTYYTDYAAVNNSDDQEIKTEVVDKKKSQEKEQIKTGDKKEMKGLLYNPWIFRTAVEVGMNISKIEIKGEGEPIEISANKIAETDMFILEFLKKRGVTYDIILNKEETIERILQKLEGSAYPEEALRDAITYFIKTSAKDVIYGIRKELGLISEECVKISLLKKVVETLSIKPGKEDILGVWLDRGKIRYHKTDYKGATLATGISQGIESLNLENHQGIIAITGKGYKLKLFMNYKNKMYIDESLLELIEETKALPELLCRIVRSPLGYAESVLKADKPLPHMVPLQGMLQNRIAMEIFEYAVAYKRAEEAITSEHSYTQLRKELLVFIKSGGGPEALSVERYAKCDEIRNAIKEVSVPHTGWAEVDSDPVIENWLLRKAYDYCIRKLRSQSDLTNISRIDQMERFLMFNNTTEEELLEMQVAWTLHSGTKITMSGKVLEGDIICINSSGTHIRLTNGISAALNHKGREGIVNGQRLQLKVVDVDMINSRVIVAEEGRENKSHLRAQSHWRVKTTSGKECVRILRDKSFGSFILRLSPKFPDSVILTIRITESPEKCLCAHIRINEVRGGYEIEGKIFKDIDTLVDVYIVNYLKSFRRVIRHRKFTTESMDAIKQRLIRSKQEDPREKFALSISKTHPGNVSFVYANAVNEAKEVLLHVVEKGLYLNGRIFPKPDDFINTFKKEVSSR